MFIQVIKLDVSAKTAQEVYINVNHIRQFRNATGRFKDNETLMTEIYGVEDAPFLIEGHYESIYRMINAALAKE
jgi:hypothetical protein